MSSELTDGVGFSYLSGSGDEKGFVGCLVKVLYAIVYFAFKYI